jgi:hypothetical protein
MSVLLAEPPITSERIDVSVPSTVSPMYAADTEGALGFWEKALSCADSDAVGVIDELEEGYVVLKSIPYQIRPIDDVTYLASFEEANIAISGFDPQDAFQSLVAEILDTFDALLLEPHLGPDAAAQLQVLRTYIGKA